ncbi:hypothetical protein, partial [Bifidobacterium bifidum]|uniref:hypothetical protein n=1 Tax=Bifidobacterium bifidum TaxID=1681 RepID=UPI001EDC57E3
LKVAADEAPGHAFLSRTMGFYYEERNKYADAEKYHRMAAATNDRDSRLALADFLTKRTRAEEALALLAPLEA